MHEGTNPMLTYDALRAVLAQAPDDLTIADLEIYGLTIRLIEALDARDFIYVHDLIHRDYGPGALRAVAAAVKNYLDRKPLKTVEDCVRFH